MQTLGEARPHYWLTLEMAKTCGVDLGQAMRDGILREDEYAQAITRCRTCAKPSACRAWLSSRETADTPPGYCRNGALFAELRMLS